MTKKGKTSVWPERIAAEKEAEHKRKEAAAKAGKASSGYLDKYDRQAEFNKHKDKK